MSRRVGRTAVRSRRPQPAFARLRSLDALRGFAILGILAINVQAFAMIGAVDLNPTAYGSLTGANFWVWLGIHLFFDRKMLPLFAALFGAGVLHLAERAAKRHQRPGWHHARRMFWLFVIGAVHALAIWSGDILTAYAIAGVAVYPWRRAAPKWLLSTGIVMLVIASLLLLLAALTIPYWSSDAYEEQQLEWHPSVPRIEQELQLYRGPWTGLFAHRLHTMQQWPGVVFLFTSCWRAAALMLIGMALFKNGFLRGESSPRAYRSAAAIGLGAGLPVVALGVWLDFRGGWELEHSLLVGSQLNFWGSFLIALGYVGAIMLLDRSSRCAAVLDRLAAIGRLALTHYLLQSVICATLFYGFGFGLFGHLQRVEQLAIVAALWILIAVVSPWWLRSHNYGPAEWLWRTLATGRAQPMRRDAAGAA